MKTEEVANPLEPQVRLNNINCSVPASQGTLRLRYGEQPPNVFQGNNYGLF
jgi:hypothetical protein